MTDHTIIRYDLNASNAARGIALLLLLWHHLFDSKIIYGYPTYGNFVFLSSRFAYVAGAMFVILSGYALAASVQDRPIGLLAFFKKRLPRLYLNYWLIALIFIPIGILFEYRPLIMAFPTEPYLKLLIQMTGFHMFIDSVSYGYNATWWFMSLILSLYLLFPLLYYLTKKFGLWFLSVCFLFNFPWGHVTKWYLFLMVWLFSFILGIYLARTNGFARISKRLKQLGIFRFILLGALILLSFFLRQFLSYIFNIDFLQRQGFDSIYAFIIMLFIFEITQSYPLIQRPLAFMGRHLFNIFLFHTFIFFYYWPDFIYGFHNPYLIFIVLLAICLIVSIAIDYIRKLLHFDKILAWIDGIKVKDKIFIN
jgi:membrane-bound acyltransferase YfiQ involved in biofilm formation